MASPAVHLGRQTEARMKLDDDGPPLPPSVAKLIRDLAT